jgi:hypothetical protein
MVEQKLNLSLDWYRYSNNMYVVYSTSSVTKWKERLRSFVDPGGYFFICELDITQRAGFMAPDFWAWIRKHQK